MFEKAYESRTPEMFAIVVASTFIMVAVVFVIYDVLVHHRNEKLVTTAARTNAIVTQLFPGEIRDKIIGQGAPGSNSNTRGLASFFDGDNVGENATAPLADLFLETTVIFADVSGFTAWSSSREPFQVFVLLETLVRLLEQESDIRYSSTDNHISLFLSNLFQYKAFDETARKRRVYKVETVGDCYVAVSGTKV